MDLSSFSWIELVWIGHLIMVGPSLIMVMVAGQVYDKSAGEACLGSSDERLRFWQFRKRTSHYYVLAFVWVLWIGWNVVWAYISGREPGQFITQVLDYMTTPKHVTTDSTSTMLAVGIFFAHILRRLYECSAVSIFSRRQVLNPLDLVMRFAFYIAAGITLVATSPPLTLHEDALSCANLKWNHGAALMIFLIASYFHNKAHKTFARLRRNKAGHIVTSGYKVPHGHAFNLVSSPHYLAEIEIYIAVGLILGLTYSPWWLLTAYVALNQTFLAYNTHSWYIKKFDEYPKNRKCLIPFLL